MTQITSAAGRGIPLRGDDIDTDRIIPARYLRSITFEGLEEHLFTDDRKAAPHVLDDARFAGASVLIVNSNFGCGSSREHAPQAIQRWGIKAIVGESFAEIFFGNSVMIGLPCVTASGADIRALMELVERDPRTEIRIDVVSGTLEANGVRCAVSLPPNIRDAFIRGTWDTTGLLLDRYDEVNATSVRLPYIAGF
jgi:3-isopropylmalate/(R)-2-methylmalate dehydratase small subunit